jgi:uncharacterized protein
MEWKTEWKALLGIIVLFLVCFYLPVGTDRFNEAVIGALYLVKWYAREHVILCLIPAFFIAGAIGVFISQASVMKYFGATANKVLAYGVASVSGTILAVCSCTVLPLFAGIYRMGAGLGPATAFLYSGPAINVLAIILTARVLGLEIGIARAVGAIIFSILIGLSMHFIFRKEEIEKAQIQAIMPEPEVKRPLWQNAVFFGSMVAILVFANWSKGETVNAWHLIFTYKWIITALAAILLGITLNRWFGLKGWKVLVTGMSILIVTLIFKGEPMISFGIGVVVLSIFISQDKGDSGLWFSSSWGFAKQILPLLLFGVIGSGFFLGTPDHNGIIPAEWIYRSVGGNSLFANFFASIVGAFMYFATLTEVPILQGLISNGMGKGPALALLLAGPALSLPSMLVIKSIMGTKKTVVYVTLVVIMSTITGMIFGTFF